jgi:hypothetical protein
VHAVAGVELAGIGAESADRRLLVAAGVSKTIDASTSEISHADAACSASSWPGPQPA